jgi:hypothetical protein
MSVELPDVLHLRLHGNVELEHFRVFYGALDEIPRPIRVYLLRDAHDGGYVTPEARAYISKHSFLERIAAVVTYGASFQVRTIMTMMSRATRVFHSKEPELAFRDDETSARVWIAKHREQSREQASQ